MMPTLLPTQMLRHVLRLLPTDLLHSIHRQCTVGAITLEPSARIRGRLYVAGRRVNLLLASTDCAPDCTRRPAPGILPL
jgi:hypothetical protein